MSHPAQSAIYAELDRLTSEFFRAVSFETGSTPPYEIIHRLFIERGLLIKNVGSSPEVSSVREFIEPRQALIDSGALTRFQESQLSETTTIFGNVAHRFSSYVKSGISSGQPFETRGMITTQFVNTPQGWKISAMAWDDERPGLSISPQAET